jgi:cyclopropane fatty-acyl-phospholipid synthase-like methyltransferase
MTGTNRKLSGRYFIVRVFHKGVDIIKHLLSPFIYKPNKLEDDGERVDIDSNKKIYFEKMNMYEKSHYRRYEFAKKIISKNGITGDFACGSGYGSIMLADKSDKVIGVDINGKVINRIEQRYRNKKNVFFFSYDILKTTYDSYFDNMVSFETIEHFAEDSIPILFGIFNTALKKGGTFIFSVPFMQEESEAAIKMGFHKTFNIDEKKVVNWLNKSGFRLLYFKYQNYQMHELSDELEKKDFIIGISRKE